MQAKIKTLKRSYEPNIQSRHNVVVVVFLANHPQMYVANPSE